MIRRIAFFDFDGTITTKDTLLEFIKFSKGSTAFYLGFLLNSPWLFAFKAGIISNQAAKEKILRWFFKGMTEAAFQEICDRFASEIIPALIRPKAIEEIRKLQAVDAEVVIVSASPGNWIRPWIEALQSSLSAPSYSGEKPSSPIKVIATILEVQDGKIAGKIEGRNCYGAEKVNRIREQYSLENYQEVYAYGDSGGDRQMLKAAKISFYKPFR